MAGRNKLFKDEVSLSKALDVFWKYGYEGSSLQMLLEAMGLNKGSLYHAFGSKKELYIKVIDQYSHQQLAFLERKLKSDENVIVAIQSIYTELIAEENTEMKYRGCLLVNALGEISFQHPSLRELVAHKLRLMEEVFLKYLNVAKQKGQIDADIPTADIAKHLLTLWSGVQINRKIYPNSNDLASVMANNLAVLNQYLKS
jgi:TetR/AcrR family transcriptional repressor of nem operon